MKQMKKFMVYAALGIMSLSITGCGNGSEQTTVNSQVTQDVIAIVNGKVVTQTDFDELYEEYLSYFGGTVDAQEYLNSQQDLLLEELVNTEVLMQKAEELGINCSEEEVETTLTDIKSQYGEEIFAQMLEAVHLTEEQYAEQIRKQLVLLKLQDEMIKGDTEVTDEEVAKYYKENQSKYEESAGADMRHILVHVENQDDKEAIKKAEEAVKEIETEIKAGATFEELAEKYASKEADSDLYIVEDLGFVEYDNPYLDPAFLEGAKALKEGEVSEPIKSSFGYHFIKVENITPAGIKPLEEVEEDIRTMLQEEKQYVLYQEKLEAWVSKADIVKYEEHIIVPQVKEESVGEENTAE